MQARKEDGRSKKTTKASPHKPVKAATHPRIETVKAIKAPTTKKSTNAVPSKSKADGGTSKAAAKKAAATKAAPTKAAPKKAAPKKAAPKKAAPKKAAPKKAGAKKTVTTKATETKKVSAGKPAVGNPSAPKKTAEKALKAAPKAIVEAAEPTRAKAASPKGPGRNSLKKEGSKSNVSFARPSPWSAPVLPPVKVEESHHPDTVDSGDFTVGETVVYPARGVADIVGVEDKDIGGRRQSFYVLRVHDTEQKILVPVNNAAQIGLRRPISEAQVREIFRILKITDVPLDTQTWNRRYRGFVEKLGTGSVFAVAEVLRDLSRVKIVKEGLSFSERQMLERARGLIVKEIAVARAKPEDQVRQQIEAIFA